MRRIKNGTPMRQGRGHNTSGNHPRKMTRSGRHGNGRPHLLRRSIADRRSNAGANGTARRRMASIRHRHWRRHMARPTVNVTRTFGNYRRQHMDVKGYTIGTMSFKRFHRRQFRNTNRSTKPYLRRRRAGCNFGHAFGGGTSAFTR